MLTHTQSDKSMQKTNVTSETSEGDQGRDAAAARSGSGGGGVTLDSSTSDALHRIAALTRSLAENIGDINESLEV